MNNMVSLPQSGLCKPLVSFQPGLLNMDQSLSLFKQKEKVVVIMGATGTGKSKLAIDIATHFPPSEIVNSDKMQVYEGLDITTNKVTKEECRGVPHHLLGTIHPNSNFTATDFCHHATLAIASIKERDAFPIIAGGSNSFIEALVNHLHHPSRYHWCFLWVDVSLPVLHSSLSARVDRMIQAGQVDEVREFFDPCSEDYNRGIRRAIGVPEFHDYFIAEAERAGERRKKRLLEAAIASIKVNNWKLANRQVQKIHRLYGMWKRNMHRLDATEVFLKGNNRLEAEEAWEEHVMSKTRKIVHNFLYEDTLNTNGAGSSNIASVMASSAPPPAMAAATH
ncbi:hypothetical protein RJT34_32135 [Clitoria ternatea]|uniref:adenylate dimethylallyltransferase (ADP/ATP-dependent) n=1 Tax=Clitoria ternatea TaxID=43366 RepID=A0AAN9EXQ5_CLITE